MEPSGGAPKGTPARHVATAPIVSPIPPGPSRWQFPHWSELEPGEDLVATGADLEPDTLLAAYRAGCFPMPINRRRIGWFSPDPRGILVPSKLRISRSLRRSARRYDVTVDTAFDQVLSGCADPARPMGWIDKRIARAYTRLHRMGWVRSIEVWDGDGLAGGLYGVAIGGLFAGESMFHRRRDASKVALVHLVDLVGVDPVNLIDVQWSTSHLASLGAEECSRHRYLELATAAINQGTAFGEPVTPGDTRDNPRRAPSQPTPRR
ncbi:MAG: leucyl/phenylalanyl-tRNA--protein transferase [Acidimicrobiales bacterium]